MMQEVFLYALSFSNFSKTQAKECHVSNNPAPPPPPSFDPGPSELRRGAVRPGNNNVLLSVPLRQHVHNMSCISLLHFCAPRPSKPDAEGRDVLARSDCAGLQKTHGRSRERTP